MQAGGHEFEPRQLHHRLKSGDGSRESGVKRDRQREAEVGRVRRPLPATGTQPQG